MYNNQVFIHILITQYKFRNYMLKPVKLYAFNAYQCVGGIFISIIKISRNSMHENHAKAQQTCAQPWTHRELDMQIVWMGRLVRHRPQLLAILIESPVKFGVDFEFQNSRCRFSFIGVNCSSNYVRNRRGWQIFQPAIGIDLDSRRCFIVLS